MPGLLFDPNLGKDVGPDTFEAVLEAGYYTAVVQLGPAGRPGAWGLEILADGASFSGGFNFGGGFIASGRGTFTLPIPGFGGFFVSGPQMVGLSVSAQDLDNPSESRFSLRVLDSNRLEVGGAPENNHLVGLTQVFQGGYHTVELSTISIGKFRSRGNPLRRRLCIAYLDFLS